MVQVLGRTNRATKTLTLRSAFKRGHVAHAADGRFRLLSYHAYTPTNCYFVFVLVLFSCYLLVVLSSFRLCVERELVLTLPLAGIVTGLFPRVAFVTNKISVRAKNIPW